MPDHLHVATPPDRDPVGLDRVLQHHARRFGARWQRIPPQLANTPRILARTVRYIIRNPTRAGFVTDPLAWPWTTLRDLVGTVAHPWVDLRGLAGRLHIAPADLPRYLAGETWSPPRTPNAGLVAALDVVAAATVAALRTTPDSLRRRTPARAVFVGLAYDIGAPRPSDLAQTCGVTTRSIRNLRGQVDSGALAAARRCLADPRARLWRAAP